MYLGLGFHDSSGSAITDFEWGALKPRPADPKAPPSRRDYLADDAAEPPPPDAVHGVAVWRIDPASPRDRRAELDR